MEPERLVAQPSFDDFLESDKRAAAEEENIGRVDREELLVRMLASTLRWNVGDGAFEDLQERLLHSLAGHVARNRRVLVLATNLVDLVDVDDALLRSLDVA